MYVLLVSTAAGVMAGATVVLFVSAHGRLAAAVYWGTFKFFSQSNNNIYITQNILLSVLHSSFLILIVSSYSSFMFLALKGTR